ncbi:MAG TPA: diguanylate cyclase [Candidatus Limnocylindrales bacterium]|nr:diguanylate cyclase [Candidatus Limnocylindrales bacterium]
MSDVTEPARDPQSILVEAAATVARSSDLDTTLNALLQLVVQASDATDGAVYLQDPDRPGLHFAGAVGITEEAAAIAPEGVEAGPGSLPLVVTLDYNDVVLGVLSVGREGSPADVDSPVLRGLADLLAIAVDRARLAATASERSDWFERMAHTDPLTGLANERTVGRILELELARAGRQESEVSIVLFDIDDFQATNREAGQHAGDDVLRRVAAVLAESVRLVDTVGRIGGDEFVLIAPGSAGLTVARRVIEGIVSLPAVAGRPVTVSAGVARFPADGTDAEALLEAAATALGQARADGRGQAVLNPG